MNNHVAVMRFTGSNSNIHSEANPPLSIIQQHEKQGAILNWLNNIQSLWAFELQRRTEFTWG